MPVNAYVNFIFSKLKEGYVEDVLTGIVKQFLSLVVLALQVKLKKASNLLLKILINFFSLIFIKYYFMYTGYTGNLSLSK